MNVRDTQVFTKSDYAVHIVCIFFQEKQAKFFENIIKTAVRPEPTYFRVGYYGRGFPTFLKVRSIFIFKMSALSSFCRRLFQIFFKQ